MYQDPEKNGLIGQIGIPEFARENAHLIQGFPQIGAITFRGIKAFLFHFPKVVVQLVDGSLVALGLGHLQVLFFQGADWFVCKTSAHSVVRIELRGKIVNMRVWGGPLSKILILFWFIFGAHLAQGAKNSALFVQRKEDEFLLPPYLQALEGGALNVNFDQRKVDQREKRSVKAGEWMEFGDSFAMPDHLTVQILMNEHLQWVGGAQLQGQIQDGPWNTSKTAYEMVLNRGDEGLDQAGTVFGYLGYSHSSHRIECKRCCFLADDWQGSYRALCAVRHSQNLWSGL